MTERPTLETLLDLSLDELPAERADEIREHLVDNAESRHAFNALFEEPDGPPALEEPVSQEEKAQAWWRLSRAIRENEPDSAHDEMAAEMPRPEPVRPLPTPSSPRQATRRAGAAAAAAVFAFGVGWFIGGGSETGSTRVGAWTALDGERTVTRGAADPLVVTCPLAKGDFIWSLPLPVGASQISSFHLEIERPDGDVERGVLAHPDALGQILITRPRSATPDGVYRIRVEDADRLEEIDVFHVSVACD